MWKKNREREIYIEERKGPGMSGTKTPVGGGVKESCP